MKLQKFIKQYRLFDFRSHDPGILPSRITSHEKYLYAHHRQTGVILACSLISFSTATYSLLLFTSQHRVLWPLLLYMALTVVYFMISFVVNLGTPDFNLKLHLNLVKTWRPPVKPPIDIFLPTAGENLKILLNTWQGVAEVQTYYTGVIKVYCLDDSDRPAVKQLADSFRFSYIVRPNRGEHKKAGNLKHAFKITQGEFIAIFDADFRPRYDFLDELLPYFYYKPRTGIVQSPQYFDVNDKQNWLERGAGAVQELFYRSAQVSRQSNSASICVGSNAIYRRAALNHIGGTALVEHSEDVHTGFRLRVRSWRIQYVPINLAKGLCPSAMTAFFKQQYRWCMGSLSLLTSEDFWIASMPLRARLSYFSGFLYYLHTAISSFLVPIVPLALLIYYADEITARNYVLILPSLFFSQIIMPSWHKSVYGIEAWSVRMIYGWAHFFAVIDKLTGRVMAWKPTGARMATDSRYITFRGMQILCNLVPGLAWVGLGFMRLIEYRSALYVPIIISGVYYSMIAAKVSFYRGVEFKIGTEIKKQSLNGRYRIRSIDPIVS